MIERLHAHSVRAVHVCPRSASDAWGLLEHLDSERRGDAGRNANIQGCDDPEFVELRRVIDELRAAYFQ